MRFSQLFVGDHPVPATGKSSRSLTAAGGVIAAADTANVQKLFGWLWTRIPHLDVCPVFMRVRGGQCHVWRTFQELSEGFSPMDVGNVNEFTDVCWKDLNEGCLGVIARLNLRLCALLTKLTLPDLTPAGGLTAIFQPAWSMIASLPMRLDLE